MADQPKAIQDCGSGRSTALDTKRDHSTESLLEIFLGQKMGRMIFQT